MSKKNFLAAAALSFASLNAMAGGLLTNTNQSAAFARQMSQSAIIDITGLYFNPAGTAFLSDGWHLSLDVQTAIQQRNIETTFPLFTLNQSNQNTTHRFEGKAFAPVIPSFQLSYNKDKWSVNANFALIGGGGKCEFGKGLGSFEALYAGQLYQQVPAAVQGMVGQQVTGMVGQQVTSTLIGMGIPQSYAEGIAATTVVTPNVKAGMTGYDLNAYMKGRNYYFGLTLGATYKFLDNLSAFLGVRGIYGTCNYNGYVQDVSAAYAYQGNYAYEVPANAGLGFPGVSGSGEIPAGSGVQNLDSNGLSLNCDQAGFGVSPIIGLDWKANKHWNLAAKFEAPTVMSLKNSTEMNDYAKLQVEAGSEPLAKFADGKKVREDVPGILTVGAQYSPVESVRLMGTFNEYFDKSAKKYNDDQKLIDKNTWEVSLGAEYDLCKLITISGSWQMTQYGLSDKAMNDLSFNLSANTMGLGLRINATERCNIDLGYMHTFYQDRTVNTATAAGTKTDLYSRKNDAVGIAVNLNF